MGTKIITSDEHLQYQNEDLAVLKDTIAMGLGGFIVYSYSLTAAQILDDLKKELANFDMEGIKYQCELMDDKVVLNGIFNFWNFSLIENTEKHFGAVIFHLCPIRNDETEEEWRALLRYPVVFKLYMQKLTIQEGCIEVITVPEHIIPLDDNGFSFQHDEIADAFRGSMELVHPYNSILKSTDTNPPTWYKPGISFSDAKNHASKKTESNEMIFKEHTTKENHSRGENHNSSQGACYIATAVYSSYDCPQVWVLRRYRDYSLAKKWYGRMFIRTYYLISPTFVRWFGNYNWFNNLCRRKLDVMVDKLMKEGLSSSPYTDKNW